MKKSILYVLPAVVLFFAACTEDKGNYDYLDGKDVIDISISGISDEGYEVIVGERLQITPEISGYIPGREYEYEWYLISQKTNLIKTLSNTLELDEEISSVPTALYKLYFKVTDAQTGVYVDYETSLTVSASTLTTGWYVLKEIDGMTDIDYCKNTTGEMFPDILSRLAPEDYRMEGKPVGIAYQSAEYTFNQVQEDGTTKMVSALKTLHVVTTEEMYTLDAEELTRYATLEDQFYAYPGYWNPQYLTYSSGLLLVNDGDLFTTSTRNVGLSKFSSAKIRGGSIFPSFILNSSGYCYGYDMATRSFMYSSNYNTNSISYFGKSGSLSSSDTVYDMVAIPTNSYTRPSSRSMVLKSTEDGKYYTVSFKFLSSHSSAYPLQGFFEVPENSLMPTAKAYTSISSLVFCFASGNTLYYYDPEAIGGTKEFVMNEYPADEEIVHLDFNNYSSTLNYQYLSVLTWNSSANTWKLYIHSMPSFTSISAFVKEPRNVFSGEGKPLMNICRMS